MGCVSKLLIQNPLSSPNYAYLKSNCGAWQSDTTGKKLWISLAFLRCSPGPSWKLLTSFTLTATQVANMKMKKHLNKPGMHADICSPTKAMQNNAWKPRKSSDVRYGGSLSCTYLLTSISTFKKVPRHAWWVAIIHSRSKHGMNKTGWASINMLKSKYTWKIPISINQFLAGCGQKGFVYGNVIGLNLQCQSLFSNSSVLGLCCHDLVGDINKVRAPVRRLAFMATLTITKNWWFWTTWHWIDVRKAVKTIERVRWRCHFR